MSGDKGKATKPKSVVNEELVAPKKPYIPAAGWSRLLPIYDPWAKLLGFDAVRKALLDQVTFVRGDRVLDLGCGTGTLAVLIRQLNPDVNVIGLDPDPEALVRAQGKAERAGVAVQFDRGFSDQLPFADASFDHVFCTGMLGLLPHHEKEMTLREVRRVLRIGASFHLLDLVQSPPGAFLFRLLHPNRQFQVCNNYEMLALMRHAGLLDPTKTGEYSMWLWPVATYHASR